MLRIFRIKVRNNYGRICAFMLRDITIGQYYQADSILHRMDPRVKLFGTIVYIMSLFIGRNVWQYVIATAFLAVIIKISKVPFKFMIKGLKAIIMLLIFSAAFNIFLTPGTVLVSIWKLQITSQGLIIATFMVIRLMYLIIGSSLMTLTTTPNNLTDGLEKSLGFLNYIKVPVHEIAMMMSIALRFIPILIEETDKIMKAQSARGADFETGGLMKKAKSMIPVLVPLFVSAFRRANELAMAMEARCYQGGKGRTKMKPLKYGRNDYTAYVILFAYLGIMIFVSIFMGGRVI